jgi:hypothetical protein
VLSIFPKDEKAERVIPEPNRFAVCAPADVPILSFYEGVFEAAYVIFHPFIRPVGIDKERFNPNTYPTKAELLAKCQPVKWQEVLELGNLTSVAEIDVGLRTAIHGLKEEFMNHEFEAEIDRIYDEHGIVMPTEGELAELIQNEIFSAIRSLGYESIWIGDEFCTERKLEWIEELYDKGREYFPPHCNYFTPDKRLLVTTHWDSHFSLICSDRASIEKILLQYPIEGFFCDDRTEIYWSLRNQN